MTEQTNFKENLTQEEIDSLAAALYCYIKDFFKEFTISGITMFQANKICCLNSILLLL